MDYYDKNKYGFSFIELLIVIAIIGVLAAIGWTNYQGLVDSVKKDTTIKNAEDIYRTLSTYSYKENSKEFIQLYIQVDYKLILYLALHLLMLKYKFS